MPQICVLSAAVSMPLTVALASPPSLLRRTLSATAITAFCADFRS